MTREYWWIPANGGIHIFKEQRATAHVRQTLLPEIMARARKLLHHLPELTGISHQWLMSPQCCGEATLLDSCSEWRATHLTHKMIHCAKGKEPFYYQRPLQFLEHSWRTTLNYWTYITLTSLMWRLELLWQRLGCQMAVVDSTINSGFLEFKVLNSLRWSMQNFSPLYLQRASMQLMDYTRGRERRQKCSTTVC